MCLAQWLSNQCSHLWIRKGLLTCVVSRSACVAAFLTTDYFVPQRLHYQYSRHHLLDFCICNNATTCDQVDSVVSKNAVCGRGEVLAWHFASACVSAFMATGPVT
ncbi:hypothetical protein BJV82DRAFT_610277 [Fennellomyces sp. T-0311]|nr:hypothetical protein BJV82DRAFT_610277 [Fennellomyces sp. T-0311]